MKHFLLLMAVIGLATTGCAQNHVFAPQSQNAGAGLGVARSQARPSRGAWPAKRETDENEFQLANFGGDGGDSGCCCVDCNADDDCGCSGGACDYTGCDCGGDEGCCGSTSCGAGGCSDGDGGGGANCGGDDCRACGGRGCGLCSRMSGRCNPHAGGYPEAQDYNPSPPMGQVAYPYYTVRGPRDFLRNNPPSIGPY